MIGIESWVRPRDGLEDEIIVGRVVHVPAEDSVYVRVAWLSNERGLWLAGEHLDNLIEHPVPELALIEALMVTTSNVAPIGD